ncbi:hypothetical protein MJH12_14640, partial [bacterium]|nr:hypothetical protein [bacterium]
SLGNVIFGSIDGYLYSLTSAGVLNWRKNTGSEIHSTAAIDNGDQIYSTNYSGLYEVRSQAGTTLTSMSIGEKLHSSVALVESTAVYFGVYADKLKVISNSGFIDSINQFSNFRSGIKNPGRMDCSTTADIVSSFTRFGSSDWGPDPSGILESKDNEPFSGIYSPTTLENYDFEAELYSPNGDDDTIALIIASHRDGANNLYSLIATRGGSGTGGAIGSIYWGLVYVVLDATDNITSEIVIVNAEGSLADGLAPWSAFSGGTRVRLTRRGNQITAETSVKTAGAFTSYVNLARIDFDLTSDINTVKFVGPQSVGFAAHSQPQARFRRINLNGVAACKDI